MIGVGVLLLLIPLTVTMAQESAPETTPEAAPDADGPLHDEESVIEVLMNARLDLERLADALNVTRPEMWNGSIDIEDPQLPALIRIDLEILAGSVLGLDPRPDGWFGVIASSPYFVARDIRHDLELLADATLDPEVNRPQKWVGGTPLLRCDRATQALVRFLNINEVLTLQADPAAADYCTSVTIEVSLFVEQNYLESSPVSGILTDTGLISTATTNSNYSVAFFDRYAVGRAGVIPNGTPIQPVARSYSQYSNMMLIRGEGFDVFVDYGFTTVSDDEFRALPNVDEIEFETECGAEWCNVVG
jgi:hypothetical protein